MALPIAIITTFLVIVVTLFIVTCIGGVFALPAFIPPLRRRARASQSFRLSLSIGLPLIAFLILGATLLILLRISVTFPFITSCGFPPTEENCQTPAEVAGGEDPIFNQAMWILTWRSITPIAFHQPCQSDDTPRVCEIVDSYPSSAYLDGIGMNLTILSLIVAISVVCGLITRWITRPIDINTVS